MPLGDHQVVAGDEAIEDVGEEAALGPGDAAHDAEIDRDDIAGPGVGEEIARMHVGVEEAVADGVAQETLEELARQFLAVEPGRVERREVADRDALDPAGGEHCLGGVVPADVRDDEALVLFGVLLELGNGGRFEPQVEFEPGRPVEGLDHIGRPQPAQFAGEALGKAGARIVAFEIGAEPPLDPGAENLDRHRAPAVGIVEHRLVHLRDRGGSDGRREFLEVGGTLMQRFFEQARDQRRIEGLHLVLQGGEIGRDLDADDVGAGAQRLAEFHIGRPEPVQRPRQPLDPAGALDRTAFEETPDRNAEAQRGRQGRVVDDGEGTLACQHEAGAGEAIVSGQTHGFRASRPCAARRCCR